ETGRRVQFVLRREDGTVPFGAMVYGAQDKVLGMIDNQSRVLVFGVEEQGRLDVRWGEGACVADYTLPAAQAGLAYDRVTLVCRPQAQ
ncbi:MAG TPA: FimD/PapC C-terminal domain-containing protein, partial [Burkholderiaceae bacterium]|nr:FimD/PapC C-terminal domain-containing protein [Burkholderiaceae bacterium]